MRSPPVGNTAAVQQRLLLLALAVLVGCVAGAAPSGFIWRYTPPNHDTLDDASKGVITAVTWARVMDRTTIAAFDLLSGNITWQYNVTDEECSGGTSCAVQRNLMYDPKNRIVFAFVIPVSIHQMPAPCSLLALDERTGKLRYNISLALYANFGSFTGAVAHDDVLVWSLTNPTVRAFALTTGQPVFQTNITQTINRGCNSGMLYSGITADPYTGTIIAHCNQNNFGWDKNGQPLWENVGGFPQLGTSALGFLPTGDMIAAVGWQTHSLCRLKTTNPSHMIWCVSAPKDKRLQIAGQAQVRTTGAVQEAVVLCEDMRIDNDSLAIYAGIEAFDIKDGSFRWGPAPHTPVVYKGTVIEVYGMVVGKSGTIYYAPGQDKRLFVIGGSDGKVLHDFGLPVSMHIVDVTEPLVFLLGENGMGAFKV